ncbi:MAG TPA: GNAT family N-acetyltransferase [Actinoplanes sp.]|jgi:predicted acetyltransferase
MPSLQAPTARLHSAFREAHHEWGPGLHEDGFGISLDDDVETAAGFAAWVSRLTRAEDPATDPRPGHSHATFRWIVEGDAIQGGIALRHTLNEALGHIGYGVRPSARRRGLATWALTEMLGEARARGLDRVLLVCAADNVGSARTILRCGGVLEPGSGPTNRYWIEL